MKKQLLLISILILFSILLCGCMEGTVSTEEYEDLQYQYEECEGERDSYEEELIYKNESIKLLFDYAKSTINTKSTPKYDFKKIWSVGDYFDFQFTYDKEFDRVTYSIKNKEGENIRWIDNDTEEIQDICFGVYRSDGTFQSYNTDWDGERLFYKSDYNYSYEILVVATVNNKTHIAVYNFTNNDIK